MLERCSSDFLKSCYDHILNSGNTSKKLSVLLCNQSKVLNIGLNP